LIFSAFDDYHFGFVFAAAAFVISPAASPDDDCHAARLSLLSP